MPTIKIIGVSIIVKLKIIGVHITLKINMKIIKLFHFIFHHTTIQLSFPGLPHFFSPVCTQLHCMGCKHFLAFIWCLFWGLLMVFSYFSVLNIYISRSEIVFLWSLGKLIFMASPHLECLCFLFLFSSHDRKNRGEEIPLSILLKPSSNSEMPSFHRRENSR